MVNAEKSQQNSRIGNLLINKGWLSSAELDEALEFQQQTGKRLGESLIHLGLIDKKQLDKVLIQQSWSRSTFVGLMMAASQLLITACGGGGGAEKAETPVVAGTNAPAPTPSNPTPPPPTSTPTNVAPTVDAGADISVEPQTNVTLRAMANDADGTVTSYQWTQVSGNPVSINNPSDVQVSFTAPTLSDPSTAESFQFEVTVSDDDGATASNTVTVTVNPETGTPPPEPSNIAPVVDAGNGMSVNEQVEVTLTATASDSDGSIASYQWTQLSGRAVTISNASSAQASFTSPSLSDPDTAESFEFEVLVTDNSGATATDSVIVTVNPAVVASEDCTLTVNPGDSFENAFAQMSPGDMLCLNDGIYQQAMDIPSDMNVQAVHDGMAELDGMDTLGIEWQGGILTMRGNNSSVRGLRVHHAGTNADACTITGTNNTMRSTSCSDGGSHKHKIPLKISGSGHLVEDSWFFGEGRYVVQCYNGDHNTIRRNVMRWDETIANEPDEPNAAMSNYSCSDMIWENNISLDYGIPETEMVHCGDMCMSTIDNDNENYRVQYLGNIVINHSQGTLNNRAFRADQKGTVSSSDITIKDFYVRGADSAIVFNPLYTNVNISNCTTEETGSDGTLGYNQPVTCSDDADISSRYVDGVKTSESLFPFANEALIKRDMCASGERQSDWCATDKSLTDYVLNK